MKHWYVLLFWFYLLPGRTTHIVGGELYYDCLGGDTYRFTLKLYRDCLSGQAPFDNPATLSIWTTGGVLLSNNLVNFPGSVNVPFVPNNPCFQAPPNVCVEEAVYSIVLNVPGNPQDILVAYQRCCRNNTIVNLVSPSTTGATYVATIRPSTVVTCNSTPRFKNFPPIAVCLGDTLRFDHSATDPDGDSLVYELCATYSGADPQNPMPSPTNPPPFTPIVFQAPYQPFYPIATNPPISIQPQTGLLTVIPSQLGQYVVGICVKEYRNGVLLTTHQRDFQFNITPCATNTVADIDLSSDFIPAPDGNFERCGAFQVNFFNTSLNATRYLWDFGLPMTNSDTSSAPQPVFVYPSAGTYTIRLIANPGYFCADTAFVTITLRNPASLNVSFPSDQCIDLNSFDFSVNGIIPPNTNLSWQFGPNAIPNTGIGPVVNGVSFSAPGTYAVYLISDDGVCRDSIPGTVSMFGHPTFSPLDPVEGCDPFVYTLPFQVQANNNQLVYDWNLGNGLSSTIQQPTTTYGPGIFSPSLTLISLTGCQDTFVVNYPNLVTVYPSPVAGISVFPPSQSIFNPEFSFFDQSQFGVTCSLFTGDGFSTDQCNLSGYNYALAGNYLAYLVVSNEFGCPDTAFVPVIVTPEFTFYIPNTFTATADDVNDIFRGYGIGIDQYDFRIYDRWGQIIFQSDQILQGWDGRHRISGAEVPAGIYVYAVDLVDVFGMRHKYRGKVLLLRKSGISN